MSFHHEYSASGSKRYLNCAGVVKAVKDAKEQQLIPLVQTSGDPAKLGTTVHALCEECLLTGKDPADFFQTFYTCESDGEKLTYFVDEDFLFGADIYVKYCRGQEADLWDAKTLVEEKSDLIKLTKADCGGSTDYAILELEGLLHVIDYKNGFGLVEAIGNTQLRIYALGIYYKYYKKYKFRSIKITIVQPHASHRDGFIRSEELSVEELLAWGKTVLVPGIKATKVKKPKLVAGDHCMYCEVEGLCKTNESHSALVCQEDFKDITLPERGLVDPNTLTLEEQVLVSKSRKKIEAWLKAVDQNLENAAFAGHKVPGKKVVKAMGNRKFPNEKLVIADLKRKKVSVDDIMTLPKLKSPAQLEKVLTSILNWDKEKISKLIKKYAIKPDKGYHLVDETDKREAIENPGAEDFIDVPAIEDKPKRKAKTKVKSLKKKSVKKPTKTTKTKK